MQGIHEGSQSDHGVNPLIKALPCCIATPDSLLPRNPRRKSLIRTAIVI
ncbi:MAG: hypothetical protein F6J90_31510 [Moorea sp. SIOASIH]|nr:hypothetical protein [Moorena sp. SIOASIH]NEO40617.1 hypothetical protein [Moorena sp. SIOASIH]